LLDQPLIVKLVQKLPRCFRARQIVPDELAHSILAQRAEVVQAFPARRIQNQKALHVAGLIQSTLALFDRHMPFHAAW
jgi:hypothetical protein